MLKRTHKVALMAVLTVVMVLAFAGVALAQWTDMSLSVVGPYGITEAQVGQISQGFVDGSWGPYNEMPRKQFVKMAVDAYKIPLYSPATPTYTDVPATDDYYAYIEGATKASLTNGVGGGKFEPNSTITREQAAAIIVRWVAAKNGYNLATYYTDAEAAAILSAFPDAAQVGPSLVKEMAFAVDFDIVWGNATGNLAPKSNVIRIQGAAMLIRSWGIVPFVPPATPPAKIELVGADKAENLIGLAHTATFKVTDAAGAPVANALVDFDTLMAGYYYVGNIAPKAGLTDANGEVKCVLLSTEPGTERVSASVMTPAGPKTQLVTKYWVVLDEVYILDDTRAAQNNVGDPHTWAARVVVFGPGPLSTSAQDLYNAVSLTADPTKPAMEMDGVDWPLGWVVALLNEGYQYLLPIPGSEDWADFFGQGIDVVEDWVAAHQDLLASTDDWTDVAALINAFLATDRWTNNTEDLLAAHGYKPRTLAGVPVTWTIVPVSSTVASVGTISAVEHSGTIAAGAKSAVGFTDADGESAITIDSTTTGQTVVKAIADYAGNPYAEKLFNHLTSQLQLHFLDWDDQPLTQATAVKTWIPHQIGDDASPISPAYTEANIGETVNLTITLKDSYGNPVAGRQVTWMMKGIGYFDTDDDQSTQDKNNPNGNKDIDVTDANGQARLIVQSEEPGEQMILCEVRDKGTNGHEGTDITYDAEVQWFDVNVVTFDDPKTDELAMPAMLKQVDGEGDYYPYEWVASDIVNVADDGIDLEEVPVAWATNEALAENTIGTDHTFTLHVYGLKLEMDPSVDNLQQQTPLIDTDYKGSSYDGDIDWKDAQYFSAKAVLFVNCNQDPADIPGYVDGEMPYDENGNGVIDNTNAERGDATFMVQGREITFTGVGGVTRYDWDDDGYKESFEGMSGIYLPLQGKDVTYALANMDDDDESNLGSWFDMDDVDAVGSFTPDTAETDANGEAQVTVSSSVKGPETVEATVDWPNNPHNQSELLTAYAKKLWIASAGVKIVVTASDYDAGMVEVANSVDAAETDTVTQPWYTWDSGLQAFVPSSAHIEVHVYDSEGNDLPDYEVVYNLENLDKVLPWGGQGAADTYLPLAFLADLDTYDYLGDDDLPYDLNGTQPDANEPTPESDPYAPIVGDGGTQAFFFNQWLGAGASTTDPGDVGSRNTAFGQGGFVKWPIAFSGARPSTWDAYYMDYEDAYWDLDYLGYYPLDDQEPSDDVGLVTDGAKAWTLDGFFLPSEADAAVTDAADFWTAAELYGLQPNLKTGSSIDVQLNMDSIVAWDRSGDLLHEMYPSYEGYADHFKSIVKIFVYAPADGLVTDQTPIFNETIHVVWEEYAPELTSIVIEQSIDGGTTWTTDPVTSTTGLIGVRGQLLDQYNQPMAGIDTTADPYDTLKLYVSSNIEGGPYIYPVGLWANNTTSDPDGYIYGDFSVGEAQTSTTYAWWDNVVTNDVRGSTELKSNELTTIVAAH